jgi:hypothetical protein
VKTAIEAIDRGPAKSVSPSAPTTALAIARASVRDSGSGIPETVDVFRLFETTKY